MKVLLAPMEGVVDAPMRELLTGIGGVDFCATEFIRVTSVLIPRKVFYKFCPELKKGGVTASGVPVYVQLLGSRPDMLAANAERAIELGAPGIDLNFGCPAKIVNRHEGGASLLKKPKVIFDIVSAVRKTVPEEFPVTVKIRLGFHDTSLALDNAFAAENGGATWLTVHGRTRDEGYKPPAHWDEIGKLNDALKIPVIANGDVWTVEDYERCVKESGCEDVMLGRGIITKPDLARQIKQKAPAMPWADIKPMIPWMMEENLRVGTDGGTLGRIKQWTKLLGRTYPEAQELFTQIKLAKSVAEMTGLRSSI